MPANEISDLSFFRYRICRGAKLYLYDDKFKMATVVDDQLVDICGQQVSLQEATKLYGVTVEEPLSVWYYHGRTLALWKQEMDRNGSARTDEQMARLPEWRKGTSQMKEKASNPYPYAGSHRRTRFRFDEYGIPVGAVLTYVYDPDITVVVQDEENVLYNGKVMLLSKAASLLMGRREQGVLCFTYRGEKLVCLRNRVDRERKSI